MELQVGIKEAVQQFWKHIGRRSPTPISEVDRTFVNEALLLALAQLKKTMQEKGNG